MALRSSTMPSRGESHSTEIGTLRVFSIAAMAGSWWFVKRRDYAVVSRGGAMAPRRRLTPWQTFLAYGWIALVLLLVLSPW